MAKRTKVRLCLALFILAVALTIVGIPAPQSAFALPCCDQACGYIYDNCVAGYIYPVCGGDPACCANKEAVCYSHCNPYC